MYCKLVNPCPKCTYLHFLLYWWCSDPAITLDPCPKCTNSWCSDPPMSWPGWGSCTTSLWTLVPNAISCYIYGAQILLWTGQDVLQASLWTLDGCPKCNITCISCCGAQILLWAGQYVLQACELLMVVPNAITFPVMVAAYNLYALLMSCDLQ